MSKYYSLDLRGRAAAYGLKHGSVKASSLFKVSRATAVRWASQLRKTGKVSIGKVGGHRPPLLEGQEAWLRERISGQAHVTLRRLQSELAERGIVVSYGAIWKFVHKLNLSFKKKACTPKKPQGLMLPASGAGGKGFKPVSQLHDWCSLMRLG